MLAPLPHSFMRNKKIWLFYFYLTSSSSWMQRVKSDSNHILPPHIQLLYLNVSVLATTSNLKLKRCRHLIKVLPLLVLEESVVLESAIDGPALVLPPLAAEPLSLLLGGDDVHLVLRAHFTPTSVFTGQGSEAKLPVVKSESSGALLAQILSHGEESRGCTLRLWWSKLMVRGSGFTMLHTGSIWLHCCSMASVFKITLKCVFSEGVMVRVFGSALSFLFSWIPGKKKSVQTQFSKCSDIVKI